MSAAVTTISVSDTAVYWIPRIAATWRSSVASIIETGRLLLQAKADCPRGEFCELLGGLPFSSRTANYLMLIAEHSALSNPHSCSDLPASWRALAELARIPAERWAEAEPKIDGDITVQKARILANRLTWDVDPGPSLADATDEQFDAAIEKAKAEGDLSHENVARKLEGSDKAASARVTVASMKARLTALRKVARRARYDNRPGARAQALIEIDRELGRIRDAFGGCRCGGHRR